MEKNKEEDEEEKQPAGPAGGGEHHMNAVTPQVGAHAGNHFPWLPASSARSVRPCGCSCTIFMGRGNIRILTRPIGTLFFKAYRSTAVVWFCVPPCDLRQVYFYTMSHTLPRWRMFRFQFGKFCLLPVPFGLPSVER